MKDVKRYLKSAVLVLSAAVIGGCSSLSGTPRCRYGSYAASNANFRDCDSLGTHNYSSFAGEKDGVVYTARGGHIDIAHLRIAADNTYYMYNKVRKHLEAGDTDFTYKLKPDPSVFKVHITYPSNFSLLTQAGRQRIIQEVSVELGQYFTWQMISWHEVITWYGHRFMGMSQFSSAFSWEDPYSNLLGTRLGAQAMEMPGYTFNEAMTKVLKEELAYLGGQPEEVAYEASDRMRGQWFRKGMGTKLLMRSIDLGYEDGYVTPVLSPAVCIGAEPLCYPVPQPTISARRGFTVHLKIEPHESIRGKYLDVIYGKGGSGPVIPSIHMPIILEDIRREAVEGGYTVASSSCESRFEYNTAAAKSRTTAF